MQNKNHTFYSLELIFLDFEHNENACDRTEHIFIQEVLI